MNGLYLDKCDELILLENQKRGLCLISAFFQGLNYQDHTRMGHILQDIVQAMNFVRENINDFQQMSGELIKIINGWNADLIQSVETGSSLKVENFGT